MRDIRCITGEIGRDYELVAAAQARSQLPHPISGAPSASYLRSNSSSRQRIDSIPQWRVYPSFVQIGKLATSTGVTVQTIRFYERQGILPEPQRKESGYRVYSDADIRRLRFIRQAKSLGFSLDEIRDILRMRERGHCPCKDVIGIAERHLQGLNRQIEHLTKFRYELERAVRSWRRSGHQTLSAGAICTLIERTMNNKRPKERAS